MREKRTLLAEVVGEINKMAVAMRIFWPLWIRKSRKMNCSSPEDPKCEKIQQKKKTNTGWREKENCKDSKNSTEQMQANYEKFGKAIISNLNFKTNVIQNKNYFSKSFQTFFAEWRRWKNWTTWLHKPSYQNDNRPWDFESKSVITSDQKWKQSKSEAFDRAKNAATRLKSRWRDDVETER